MLEISITKILSPKELESLHKIVNTEYLHSESEFWNEGYERVSVSELKKYNSNKELILVYLNNEIIGCSKIEKKNEELTFSMLCISQEHQSNGYATQLYNFIEKYAIQNNIKVIKLELLIPKYFLHPDKEKLKYWYSKLGYKSKYKGDFNKIHPNLVSLMKIECDFEIWEKEI